MSTSPSKERGPAMFMHRDDIPFQEIERVEAALKKQYPGMEYKIVFPGDMPPSETRDHIIQAIKEAEEAEQASVEHGLCLHCECKMQDYRPQDDAWEIPDGWLCTVDESDFVCGWLCPDCSQEHIEAFDMDEDYGEEWSDWENERWTTTDEE